MGNKIKDLGEIHMGKQAYSLELNGGTKTEKFDVHIQNDYVNICLKDYEFAQFATAILVANRRLDWFKKNHE